jgi:hypothetical protein
MLVVWMGGAKSRGGGHECQGCGSGESVIHPELPPNTKAIDEEGGVLVGEKKRLPSRIKKDMSGGMRITRCEGPDATKNIH